MHIQEINCGGMPDGYRIVYSHGDEHYHWMCGEVMSEAFSNRFDARRAAIADFNLDLLTLRRDAERYRWLREQHWDSGTLAVVARPKEAIKLGHDSPSRARLDEAIDAARLQVTRET